MSSAGCHPTQAFSKSETNKCFAKKMEVLEYNYLISSEILCWVTGTVLGEQTLMNSM